MRRGIGMHRCCGIVACLWEKYVLDWRATNFVMGWCWYAREMGVGVRIIKHGTSIRDCLDTLIISLKTDIVDSVYERLILIPRRVNLAGKC